MNIGIIMHQKVSQRTMGGAKTTCKDGFNENLNKNVSEVDLNIVLLVIEK